MRYNKLVWTSILCFILLASFASAVTDYSKIDAYLSINDDDRTNTTLTDLTGNGYSGLLGSGVDVVNGKLEQGALTDTSEYITIASNDFDTIGDGSTSFSTSFWLYPNSVTGNQFIFDKSDTTTTDTLYCFMSGTNIRCQIKDSTGTFVNYESGSIFSTSNWYFIVFQHNEATNFMEVWVNGVNYGNVSTSSIGNYQSTNDLKWGDRTPSPAGVNAIFDEISVIMGATYTKEEIVDLYNSGSGKEPTFATPPIVTDNFTLDTRYVGGGFVNNTYLNITYANGTTIQTKNATGYIIYTNETLNSSVLVNLSIRGNHSFNKNFFNYNFSDNLIANVTSYPYLRLRDSYNNNSINGASVHITTFNYSASNSYGRIYVPYNTTRNVLLHSPTYWGDGDTLNLNLQSSHEINLFQAQVRPTATAAVTGSTISGARFVAGTQTAQNGNLYLQADTYTLYFYKNGYFPVSQALVTTAKSNQTATFTNMSNALIEINGSDVSNGGLANNFTAYLTNLDYNLNLSITTTNGSVYYYVTQGIPYNITIDAPSYSWGYSSITPSQQNTSIAISLYSTNSINFSFIDELTQNAITKNVTIELIGSVASYNFTDNAGYHYIDLITPDDYTVRYSANGYLQGFYLLTVTDRSAQNTTLYLLNESRGTNVTITVLDQSNNYLEGAVVRVLKYDVASNQYITTQILQTNFEGQTQANIVLNSEFYKFRIEYPKGTTVKETTATYIYANELTFTVVIGSLTGEIFKSSQNMTYSLAYTSLNQFRASFSSLDNSIDRICLYAYSYSNANGRTLTNTSCSTSQSGIIYTGTRNVSGSVVIADLYVTIDGKEYYIDSYTKEFGKNDNFGVLGVFVILILTLFMAMIGLRNPAVAFILTPLPLVFGTLAGFIILPMSVVMSVVVLSIAAIIIISRRT